MFTKRSLFLLGLCALAGFLAAVTILFINFHSINRGSVNIKLEKKQIKFVADNYFKAWEEADAETMYKYISAEDKKSISIEEYKAQFSDFPVQPASHEFKSITCSPPLAKIVLLVAWPDFSTGKNIQREEVFYLNKENNTWKIREAVSLEK